MVNWTLVVAIVVPLGTLVLGKYLDRWLTKRPRLVSWLGHTSAFTIQGEPTFTLHTHAIVIRNTGRLAANNVRIGHHALPTNYQIYPSVDHTCQRNSDGSGEIVFPTLVPGEQVTISYLYYPPLLWNQVNAYAKSDEGFAKVLNVLPTPQWPRWLVRSVWCLVFVGGVTLVYLLVQFVLWLLSRYA
jgi:hypothetical protein